MLRGQFDTISMTISEGRRKVCDGSFDDGGGLATQVSWFSYQPSAGSRRKEFCALTVIVDG